MSKGKILAIAAAIIILGVFQVWNDYHFFENVSIGDHREIKWDSEIELCGDSLYLELTHKSPEDLFPQLQREQPHA